MKKTILSISIVATCLCGCRSKAEKIFDKMCNETEKYIDALEDVKDKDEHYFIDKLYREKVESLEDELDQEVKNIDCKELQKLLNSPRIRDLKEQLENAEKAARNRVNKQ